MGEKSLRNKLVKFATTHRRNTTCWFFFLVLGECIKYLIQKKNLRLKFQEVWPLLEQQPSTLCVRFGETNIKEQQHFQLSASDTDPHFNNKL